MSQTNKVPFGDRLIQRVRALGHPLCVGLDPHLDRIPALFRQGTMQRNDPSTAKVVEAFCRAVIERSVGKVPVVKPQIAFFEQLGWRGLRALERVIAHARVVDPELLVVLDAKRGDIGSTAAGYAAAYLTTDAPVPVDALTVNPYLGVETLGPLVDAARDGGSGLFVLVKTSNPGSGDFQDRTLHPESRSLYEQVAAMLAPIADQWRGGETGWSSLGVVVGATYPGESERVRALLPRSPFLVPGYGAQGGAATDAVRGFVAGPDGRGEGGIVSSSRGVIFPPDAATEDRTRFDRAIDDAIDRAADDLASAIQAR